MTTSEENYLKVIYHLSHTVNGEISTNAIAEMLETKASSVTDMIKKLSDKDLISYQKYQGVSLTEKGMHSAKMIVRKHRLWEVFLVEKLQFSWDEVHDIAEELEHIQSSKLINKLEEFLDFPNVDPHGDPIPDKFGEIAKQSRVLLADAEINKLYTCVGVKDSSSDFLKFLDKNSIALGSKIQIMEREKFDSSLTIQLNNSIITLSNKIASNLYVQ